MAEFITVPKDARATRCRGADCGEVVYWVERPRAGAKPGVVRIPVHCDVPGGVEPDAFTEGKGVNHFTDCPNARDF